MLMDIDKICEKYKLIFEVPKLEFGDISIACFGKSSSEIDKIKQEIMGLGFVKKIELIGGYLNIWLKDNKKFSFIYETLKSFEKRKKEKFLVEHTSINPNASPHIGRARNAIIGDSVARLLSFFYNVERHYYVNDIGKQVAMLALVCKGNENFDKILRLYQASAERIEHDKEFEKKVLQLLEKIENNDIESLKKVKKIVEKAVKGQKAILKKININFDYFDYESDFLEEAKRLVNEMQKKGLALKDEEGKIVFDLRGSGLEQGMKTPFVALTRPDGTTLYLTRDIAYTIWRLKRAPHNIIVLGEDQKLYFQQLTFILKKLGYNAPKVLHYSMVLLLTPAGPAKMSTRAGNLVLLEDFLEEVYKKLKEEAEKRKSKLSEDELKQLASNVVRYTIAKIDYEKNVIFDLQQALRLEGDTAIYLNYSLARAKSIVRKLKIKEKISKKEIKSLRIDSLNNYESLLLHQLFNFGFTLNKAIKNFDISLIARYLYQTCKIFNDFYEQCSIIKAEKNERKKRVVILLLGIKVIEKCFEILGLNKLEKI